MIVPELGNPSVGLVFGSPLIFFTVMVLAPAATSPSITHIAPDQREKFSTPLQNKKLSTPVSLNGVAPMILPVVRPETKINHSPFSELRISPSCKTSR